MKAISFLICLFIISSLHAQSIRGDQVAVKVDSSIHARKYQASKQHQSVQSRIHALKKASADSKTNKEESADETVTDTAKVNSIKLLREAPHSRVKAYYPALSNPKQ